MSSVRERYLRVKLYFLECVGVVVYLEEELIDILQKKLAEFLF